MREPLAGVRAKQVQQSTASHAAREANMAEDTDVHLLATSPHSASEAKGGPPRS